MKTQIFSRRSTWMVASIAAVAALTVGHRPTPQRKIAPLALDILKWNKTELSVCFADPNQMDSVPKLVEGMKELRRTHRKMPGYFTDRPKLSHLDANERAAIREAVTREYTPEKTGITFTGWEPCNPSAKADVWVFGASGGPMGYSPTGRDGRIAREYFAKSRATGQDLVVARYERTAPSNEPNFVYLRHLDKKEDRLVISELMALQASALHEFGHVTGLIHEHERDEAEHDPQCRKVGVRRETAVTMNANYFSWYDRHSIMNYCHVQSILRYPGYLAPGAVPTLSPDDQRALRCIYTDQPQTPACPPRSPGA